MAWVTLVLSFRNNLLFDIFTSKHSAHRFLSCGMGIANSVLKLTGKLIPLMKPYKNDGLIGLYKLVQGTLYVSNTV